MFSTGESSSSSAVFGSNSPNLSACLKCSSVARGRCESFAAVPSSLDLAPGLQYTRKHTSEWLPPGLCDTHSPAKPPTNLSKTNQNIETALKTWDFDNAQHYQLLEDTRVFSGFSSSFFLFLEFAYDTQVHTRNEAKPACFFPFKDIPQHLTVPTCFASHPAFNSFGKVTYGKTRR